MQTDAVSVYTLFLTGYALRLTWPLMTLVTDERRETLGIHLEARESALVQLGEVVAELELVGRWAAGVQRS